MTEEKFTKGPWSWNGFSVVNAGSECLCALVNSAVNTGDPTEDYANAALISTVTEMYEMLKAIASGANVATYEINELLSKARGEK